jgi:hypothetical protein
LIATTNNIVQQNVSYVSVANGFTSVSPFKRYNSKYSASLIDFLMIKTKILQFKVRL